MKNLKRLLLASLLGAAAITGIQANTRVDNTSVDNTSVANDASQEEIDTQIEQLEQAFLQAAEELEKNNENENVQEVAEQPVADTTEQLPTEQLPTEQLPTEPGFAEATQETADELPTDDQLEDINQLQEELMAQAQAEEEVVTVDNTRVDKIADQPTVPELDEQEQATYAENTVE